MPMDRRDFLMTSAGTVAAMAWGSSTRAADRNDVLRVGIAGINGRGIAHISGFENLPGVEVVALCDVDEKVLAARSDKLDADTKRKVKRFTDVRKMIEDKDIDIISTATPNHWHALIGIWAMQAGKDMYVEKPCSHNVIEGQRLIEAARKYNRICQHGTQGRSSKAAKSAVKFLQEGGIGKIHTAKGLCYKWRPSIGHEPDGQPPKHLDWNLWQGPAQEKPFSTRYVHYDWHWFWDYGNGDIGNQGVHQMDVARWGLGVKSFPKKVTSTGGRFGYQDDGQTPNTMYSALDYGDAQLIFEVRGLPSNDEQGVKIGNIWYGTEGYLALQGYDKWATFYGKKGEPGETSDSYLAKHDIQEDDHFANFIEAVRTRDASKLNAEIAEGHLSSALCHLANIAYRLGRPVQLDPEKEDFGKDGEANQYLTREYRSEFTLPKV